jgi:hypothetical protein
MTWAPDVNYDEQGNRIGGQVSSWDVVVIGGVYWPGIAKVNVKAPSGVDVQKPKGGKRAKIEDNGDPPLDIDITVTLTPAELQEFTSKVVPLLRPRGKTKGKQPLEFLHPMAEVWGISNILVLNADMAHPEPGGTMKVRVRAIEWVPQPAKVRSGSGVRRLDDRAQPRAILAEPSEFLQDPLAAANPETVAIDIAGDDPFRAFGEKYQDKFS